MKQFIQKYQKRLLIIFGVVFLFSGSGDFYNGWFSRLWPSVSGKIIKVSFEDEKKDYNHFIEVKYKYTVKGYHYIGKKIAFGDSFKIQFNKGDIVDVYFSPQNPKNSVLIPGLSLRAIWVIASGVFSIFLAIVLIWAKFVIRRILFGIFLTTLGLNPLINGGVGGWKAIKRGCFPPICSQVLMMSGGVLLFLGGRKTLGSLKELISKYEQKE